MKKRKISRRVQSPTVWEALNEPIAYPSNEFAQNVFVVAAFILLMAWVAPYWNKTQTYTDLTQTYTDRVAGASLQTTVPEWYYVAQAVPGAVAEEFGQAAYQVLDVSEPASQVVEFYEPGVVAVWDAWLELMADPY